MHFVSIFLLVMSSNIDNFIVAAACGVKKLKINMIDNLVFALISCSGTLLSMYIGKTTCGIIAKRSSTYIGSIIIIIIGLWIIYDTIKSEIFKRKVTCDLCIPSYNTLAKNPEKADIDSSGYIDTRESVLLGISLAANNIGMGFGAGAAGISIITTSAMTFLFSIIAISAGLYTGKKYSTKISTFWSGIISALLIIFIGIYEIII